MYMEYETIEISTIYREFERCLCSSTYMCSVSSALHGSCYIPWHDMNFPYGHLGLIKHYCIIIIIIYTLVVSSLFYYMFPK